MIKTTSLSLSLELKKNGFLQDTAFYWREYAGSVEDIVLIDKQIKRKWDGEGHYLFYAAPLAGEIGILLPSNLDEFIKSNLDDLNTELYFEWCNTEHPFYNPDLLAKVWLVMKKEGLIK